MRLLFYLHKKTLIAGAVIVAFSLIFLSFILYGRLVLDCYEISDRFDREFEHDACNYGGGFYFITALSLAMLGFGGWLVYVGVRSISLSSLKKS
jgi:hypothetical protein